MKSKSNPLAYPSKKQNIGLGYTRKISEVFLEFALPFAPMERLGEDFKPFVEAAVRIWNLPVLPEAERDVQRIDFLRSAATNGPEFQKKVRDMIAQRETTYATDKRLIVNYKLEVDANETLSLVVESKDTRNQLQVMKEMGMSEEEIQRELGRQLRQLLRAMK